MNKSKMISAANAFLATGIAKSIYIDAGGALLWHGLRDSTKDIDCFVDVRTEIYLRDNMEPTIVYPDGTTIWQFPTNGVDIDVHKSPCIRARKSFVELPEYPGVFIQSLEGVLALKTKLDRKKDKEDIRKIKELLGI